MDIIITEWALNSYLDLKHRHTFSNKEYKTTLRPDVELLKQGYPSTNPKFEHSKFWGPATDLRGKIIKHGFKMKWHNIGNGRVQLRLAIIILNGKSFLCQGYIKSNEAADKRQMALLKNRINNIADGTYSYRGLL